MYLDIILYLDNGTYRKGLHKQGQRNIKNQSKLYNLKNGGKCES